MRDEREREGVCVRERGVKLIMMGQSADRPPLNC